LLRVLRDDKWVIHVVLRMKLEEGVVIHVIVEPLRAERKTRHALALVNRLGCVGQHAGLDQLDDAIREQLCVHAQVPFILQVEQHCVGNLADAHLHRRAIGDQVRDMHGNLLLQLARRPHRHLDNRIADRHDMGQPADMDEAVAQRAGHLVVDLRDDDVRRLRRGLGQPDLHTVSAIAVLVRR